MSTAGQRKISRRVLAPLALEEKNILVELESSWMDEMFTHQAKAYTTLSDGMGIPKHLESFLLDVLGEEALFGRLLDVACGCGRLTPVLSKRARELIGVDRSRALLKTARERFNHHRHVEFVHGDMCRLSDTLQGGFNLMLRMYTSLGSLTEEKERLFLQGAYDLLCPEGALLVDTFHGNWFCSQKYIQREKKYETLTLREEYRGEPEYNRCACRWTFELEGGAQKSIPFYLELYTPERMCRIFVEAGFAEPKFFSEQGELITEDSKLALHERLWILAAKSA
jgi:ubiquinone/menaquinone biosynthesis C-methylase UbiE